MSSVRGGTGTDAPSTEWPFLTAGGTMAELISARDWSSTPLGPIRDWPAGLRTAVGIMLRSRFPMFMGWGEDLAMFYNDAYVPILADKHPAALGQRMDVVWADVWDVLAPLVDGVLAGKAHFGEDLLLVTERAGFAEETYFTFSYSPIPGDGDGVPAATVAGLFCACTETTGRVLGERRLRILRELGGVSAVTAPTVAAAAQASLQVLERGRVDVPFASIYLLSDAGRTARRTAFYGMADDPGIVPVEIRREDDPGHPVWRVLTDGPTVLTGLARRHAALFTPTGAGMGDADPDAAVAVPLAGTSGGTPVGVLFAGASSYRPLDTDYRHFLELVGRQVSMAIADAAAYQAQRRRAEELAELDRAKTAFFTGVSHELRTPLTMISGPAQDALADRAEPLPAGQRARMELIARNSGRLRRLVDTMLDFSRLEAGRLVPERVAVDLAAVTRGIAQSFSPAVTRAGLDLHIDCPELPAAVSVDVDMWERIVLNLLSNAVKYTFTGDITVRVRPAERAGRAAADTGVELQIIDTGIGIDAAHLAPLFGRFQRVPGAAGRSHEGSGIGLALVAELAALHGGHASVASTPGQGSTFTVTLPAAAWTDAPARGAADPSAAGMFVEDVLQWIDAGPDLSGQAGPDDAARATVLVAEDNPELGRYLAQLLAPHYTVLLARDGRTALTRARAERPDLVVSDVMMSGLDGFALIGGLRADPRTATTPVILLSARAGQEAVGEGLAAGADDYLVKPFSPVDLLARVRSNLEMARLRYTEGAFRLALTDSMQDAFCVFDATDGAIVEVNPAATELLGLDPARLPILPPYPHLATPQEDPEEAALGVQRVREAMHAGRGRFDLPVRHTRTRARRWLTVSYSSFDDRQRGRRLFVAVMSDITEQHRSAERDRLLAETWRLLSRPGGLRERLTDFAAVAAPLLADMAVVSLAGPDDRLTTVAAAHRSDPATAEALLALAPHSIPMALRERYLAGRAFAVTPVPDPMPAEVPGDADLHARRAVATRSSLVVPLTVAGRLLGTLSFGSLQEPREHDAADLALAEELGRRVAATVEADRVATRERQLHTATTAFATAVTLAESAGVLAETVAATTGATGIAVYVAHSDDPHLHLIHSVGYPDEVISGFARIRTQADLPVADAARTRTPVWLGDQQEWRARYPHMAVGEAAAAAHAVAALPLLIGDRVVGVLATSFPTARTFPVDEQSFVLTLAGQAAAAFDRAAITDAHRQIAQTLQRSLLPGRLPCLPRLALAAHYEPAGQYTQAGGDWYDVIGLDEDRVAIVVGDVVGNGAGAAAVMGQLRSALTGFLMESHAPAHALAWLSRLAQRIDGALGSTVTCMVLDTGTGELRWARAGHPPPLLLDPGAPDPARFLDDATGLLLGLPDALGAHIPYTEGHTVLSPGSSVLLYTDGLVEYRGESIDEGLRRLADSAGAAADSPPAVLLDAALDGCSAGAGPADDIALIVARLLPAPVQGRLPARPDELAGVRRAVEAWSAAGALPDGLVDDLQLALGEAVANAVEHAYRELPPGEIDYRLERLCDDGDGSVRVEVRDHGRWRPPVEDPGFRGRGLTVIRALGHDVDVETTGSGTRVRFTLPVPPAGPRAPIDAPAALRPVVPAGLRVDRDAGGALVLRLSGELDLAAVTPVRAELLHRITGTSQEVVLDLSEVGYLASAGVGLLVQAHQAAPERVRVHVPPGSPAARTLALAGLDGQLGHPGGPPGST